MESQSCGGWVVVGAATGRAAAGRVRPTTVEAFEPNGGRSHASLSCFTAPLVINAHSRKCRPSGRTHHRSCGGCVGTYLRGLCGRAALRTGRPALHHVNLARAARAGALTPRVARFASERGEARHGTGFLCDPATTTLTVTGVGGRSRILIDRGLARGPARSALLPGRGPRCNDVTVVLSKGALPGATVPSWITVPGASPAPVPLGLSPRAMLAGQGSRWTCRGYHWAATFFRHIPQIGRGRRWRRGAPSALIPVLSSPAKRRYSTAPEACRRSLVADRRRGSREHRGEALRAAATHVGVGPLAPASGPVSGLACSVGSSRDATRARAGRELCTRR